MHYDMLIDMALAKHDILRMNSGGFKSVTSMLHYDILIHIALTKHDILKMNSGGFIPVHPHDILYFVSSTMCKTI